MKYANDPIKIIKYNYYNEIIDTYEIPRNDYIKRDEEDIWRYNAQDMLIKSGTTYKKCTYAIPLYFEDEPMIIKEIHFCCEPFKDEKSKLRNQIESQNPGCSTAQWIIEKRNNKWGIPGLF